MFHERKRVENQVCNTTQSGLVKYVVNIAKKRGKVSLAAISLFSCSLRVLELSYFSFPHYQSTTTAVVVTTSFSNHHKSKYEKRDRRKTELEEERAH